MAPFSLAMRLLLGAVVLIVQVAAECSQTALYEAANRYIAAQSLGQVGYMVALTPATAYLENDKPANISAGILSQPLKIDHARSIYDPTACATYTELIAADPKHPYVIGTQQRFANNGTIVRVETLVTDAGDWLFNAAHTLYYALRENRETIAADKRDSRETMQAVADAYFNAFKTGNGSAVPWGEPCLRVEGGLNTAKNGSCDNGVPSGVELVNRRYVIDQAMGTVSVFLTFGGGENGSKLPDSHEFRIESGKIVGVHTITVCAAAPMCGFNLSDELKAELSRDLGY
jgi:hypothetical protein